MPRRGCRVVTTSLTARLLLARQLRELPDIAWTVVSGDDYDDPPPGVQVAVVPMRREPAGSDLRSFLGLVRFLRVNRFDFVQTHTPKASALALPAARLTGQCGIYTVHGALYFKGNGRLANILGWCFERWCCTWARRVLVQSEEDAEALPRARICSRRKLAYLGNGIDLTHFTTPEEPALPNGLPVVLMVSRLVREKGCADFLALARSLAGSARFVHVGPEEHDQRDALSGEEVAAASDVVQFVGPVDDVRPYIAAATVVVLPSYREGIPRAAMEAAAAGVPVAAYDIRGVREVLPTGLGLLAPRGDIDALRGIVAGLVADPELARGSGEACRARVLAMFSEDDVVERLRAVYDEVTPHAGP